MMVSKEELIHSLRKVKLVLGNGFDLHCGLRSSFKHYSMFCGDKIKRIEQWYNSFKEQNNTNHTKDVTGYIKNIDEISVWDVFFTILSIERHGNKYTDYLWSGVENDIKESLLNIKKANSNDELVNVVKVQLTTPINWDFVFDELKTPFLYNSVGISAVSHIVRYKAKGTIHTINDFYLFLLCELKKFENDFSFFLRKQLLETTYANFGIINDNNTYFKKAVETIETICDPNNLSSIESFNYTYIKNSRFESIFANINGTIDCPIFGIDSIFEPTNPKFIFTKTNRRTENDSASNKTKSFDSFDNIIIYGHSLKEADYSYFFPIFDEIRIFDNNSSSKIIFAYSIYDEGKKNEIIAEIRTNVFYMFEKYAIERKSILPNRFLDSLTTRNRVIFYEVPLIETNKYPKTIFDEQWEGIEHKYLDDRKSSL